MTPNELTVSISVEVMGWHRSPSGKTWRNGAGEHMRKVSNWNPTSDIQDAFHVLEKMQKLGFCPGMEVAEGKWWATMRADWASPYCLTTWEDRSPNPALAICRAALKWMRNPKARKPSPSTEGAKG